MKKTISISAIFLAGFFMCCEKNTSGLQIADQAKANAGQKTMCMTDPKKMNCEETYAPVCACSSVTYANVCEAQKAGLLRWVKGTCEDYGGG
ncbi:MAG: hypothetical protein ABIQ56_07505 [Chitinophagaceae bacterium]